MGALEVQVRQVLQRHGGDGPRGPASIRRASTRRRASRQPPDAEEGPGGGSLGARRAGTAYSAGFGIFKENLGIAAKLKPLPSWGVASNAAAEPPISPACATASACGPSELHDLVPHGGTELRVGELPVAFYGADGKDVRGDLVEA